MLDFLMYLVYLLALVAIVFIFCFFYAKLEVIRTRHKIIKELVEKGYESEKIDLNNYIKL